MKKRVLMIIALAAAVLVLPACVSTSLDKKAVHAAAAKEGEQGINVGTDVNAAFGNVNLNLDNVGAWDTMPENWNGPLPPGWTPNNVELVRAEAVRAQALAEKAKAELELERLRRSGETAPVPPE